MMDLNAHARPSRSSDLVSPDGRSSGQPARRKSRRYASRGLSHREFDMVAHIFGFRDVGEMAAFAAQLAEKKAQQP